MRTLLLAAILVGAGLAGCISDDEADEPLRQARAQVDDLTGGIEGVITDVAISPVFGASVTLAQIDILAESQDDGSFALDNVPPGDYIVEVTAEGYVTSDAAVTVRAGEVSTVDFVLTAVATENAFTQLFELNGFVECGQQVGWDLWEETGSTWQTAVDATNGTVPLNATGGYGVTWFFLGLATCNVPNAVGENTTNDRFIHFFELQPPVETMLYKMEWNSNGQNSATFSPNVELAGFSNNDRATFVEKQEGSPIIDRVDKERFIEVDEYLSQSCEADPASSTCGVNPWDNGWSLQSRVFAGWNCFSEKGGVCSPVQQAFTIWIEAYYHDAAPEGITL